MKSSVQQYDYNSCNRLQEYLKPVAKLEMGALVKIAVLGAGAMGSLFGGYLTIANDVFLIDIHEELVTHISQHGVKIREKDNSESIYKPNAYLDCSNLPVMDLVIVFVKSMFTISAIERNQRIISNNTYLMTLQNGAGHEKNLLRFTDAEHVIIGSTQHNSSILSLGCIHHGGSGKTAIGSLGGNCQDITDIAENFSQCGFETSVSANIQKQIWSKLFLNTSSSSLTAIFQVPLGIVLENQNLCYLMEKLAHEAVAVANGSGLDFCYDEVIEDIKSVIQNSKQAYTSIYSDLKNGRKTEVDTISGSVVDSAKQLGIEVPNHVFVVQAIHAMETLYNRREN